MGRGLGAAGRSKFGHWMARVTGGAHKELGTDGSAARSLGPRKVDEGVWGNGVITRQWRGLERVAVAVLGSPPAQRLDCPEPECIDGRKEALEVGVGV